MRKLFILVVTAVVFSCAGAEAAVVALCDEASLRAAISQGGTVTFACNGTITLTQAITVATNVVLDGSGADVTLSGDDKTRLFNVLSRAEFELRSLQLTRGIATYGGAVSNDGGTLVLRGVTIISNNATPLVPGYFGRVGPGAGGAIYSRTGLVIATDCLFLSNRVYAANGYPSTSARGGAICIDDGGWLKMTNCTFIQNRAVGGHAVADTLPIPIFGTDALGGAVFSAGRATVYRCRFSYNEASGGGGQAVFTPTGASTIGSPGGMASGAVIYTAGSLELGECALINNGALGGGGGFGSFGFGATGSGGPGGDVHGAVIGNGGALWMWGCTFATNRGVGGEGGEPGHGFPSGTQGHGTAGGSGGSGGHVYGTIYTTNSALIYVTNCTIAGNTLSAGSGRSGGQGNPCLVTGCTTGGLGGRGGNGGNAAGAGLHVAGGTSMVVHCTFDRNAVVAGTNGLGGPGGNGLTGNGARGPDGMPGVTFGAALSVAGGSVQAMNSIFSRGQGATNCSGLLQDLGVNICSDTSACFTNPATLKNVNAGLSELGDNGGPTLTISPSAVSPAYNRGNNLFAPPTDQRGVPRPQGKFCDIGAFELGRLTLTKSGTEDSAVLRYGAPPGTVHRLQGQIDWGEWRDLAVITADPLGDALYGPIPLTNRIRLFRTRTPP